MSNLGVKNESRIEKKSGTEKRYVKKSSSETLRKNESEQNPNWTFPINQRFQNTKQ